MVNEPASIPETRFRRVGAAPNEGGPVAASRHQSGRGGTTGEGESGKCSSLGEPNRAGGTLSGIEESGPCRTETAVEWEAVTAVASEATRGSRESRVPERSMDPG